MMKFQQFIFQIQSKFKPAVEIFSFKKEEKYAFCMEPQFSKKVYFFLQNRSFLVGVDIL